MTLSMIIVLYFATMCMYAPQWIRFWLHRHCGNSWLNVIVSTVIFYILLVATFQDKIATNDCRNYKVWNKLSCFRIREFLYSDAGKAYGQTEADCILGMKQ